MVKQHSDGKYHASSVEFAVSEFKKNLDKSDFPNMEYYNDKLSERVKGLRT